MGKALSDLLAAFSAATPVRRLLWALLPIVPIAALLAVWLWLHQPPYRVLYASLPDRAGGEVMAALDQLGIGYHLSARDGAIEVRADEIYAARFKLAARGLPRLDETAADTPGSAPAFGQSQFQEQLAYQRALQNDLVHAIETLQNVARARVQLAIPRVSPFLREPPPVTAAVLLELKTDAMRRVAALTPEQVLAIQRMVAASVPRLKPADVSVLDQRGRLLDLDGSTPEAQQTRIESRLTARLGASLAPLFGAHRVRVQTPVSVAADGAIQRIDASVILAFDASAEQIAQAATVARQTLGLNAKRGDRLNVFALPPVAATPTPAPAPLASKQPAPPRPDDSAMTGVLPWAALGLVALVVAGLRRRRVVPAPADEAPPDLGDGFDSALQNARQISLDDPRVTADVIRLWMRA